jgi:hypothetical protein
MTRIGSAPEMYWRSWCAPLASSLRTPCGSTSLGSDWSCSPISAITSPARPGEADAAHVQLRVQGRARQRAFQQQAVPAEEALAGNLAVLELHGRAGTGWVCLLRRKSLGSSSSGPAMRYRFDIDARDADGCGSDAWRQSAVRSGHADAAAWP